MKSSRFKGKSAKKRVKFEYERAGGGLVAAIHRDRERQRLAPNFKPPWGPPHFIRFGAPPPDGVSKNHWADIPEAGGVSCYAAHFDHDLKAWVIELPDGVESLLSFPARSFRGRAVYLLRGNFVGFGSAGEPLLNPVEQIVRILPPSYCLWEGRILGRAGFEDAVLEAHKSWDPAFQEIVEAVLPHSTAVAKASRIHGVVPHWYEVMMSGRMIAIHMATGMVFDDEATLHSVSQLLPTDTFESQEVDLDVVRWFAALHDSQRLNDGRDPEHGARAATKARELRDMGIIPLEDGQFAKLEKALRLHNGAYVSAEDIDIGACFDADRLTLRRVGVKPKVEYLSTPFAQGFILRRERKKEALK